MPRRFTVACLYILLALTIMVALSRFLRPELAVLPEIGLPVEPGEPLPPDAECSWHYASPEDAECMLDDGAYADYSKERRVITSVGEALDPPVPIGNFITAWGLPTSATYGPFLVSLFWGHREALAEHGEFFGPLSATYFVIDHLDTVGVSRWHGFTGR